MKPEYIHTNLYERNGFLLPQGVYKGYSTFDGGGFMYILNCDGFRTTEDISKWEHKIMYHSFKRFDGSFK